jgi:hypothetical protein
MTTSPASISTDLPCVSCGYNLRGLDPAGRCPECATPVRKSLHEDLLRYAHPGWLRKVRWGARILYWSGVLSLLVGLPPALAAFFAVGSARRSAAIVIASQFLVYIIGTWLLTVQEPRLSLNEPRWPPRKTLRIAAAIMLTVAAAHMTVLLVGVPDAAPFTAVLLFPAAATLMLTLFSHARALALRIPSVRLARAAGIIRLGLTFGLLALGLAAAAATLLPTSWTSTLMSSEMFASVVIITLLATVVLFVWGCDNIGYLHKALVIALDTARYLGSGAGDRD